MSSNSTDQDVRLAKAHGCLMVIAWMFLAPTGILFARYFKTTTNRLICGMPVWFFFHWPVMILATCATIGAFVCILVYSQGYWVDTSETVTFVHSMFGIVTICFSIIQVTMGIFRPHPDHRFRFIFQFFHRFLGISAFICSLVAMFLGTLISDVMLGNAGWPLVTAWIVWVFVLPLLLELIDLFFSNYENYAPDTLTSFRSRHKKKFKLVKAFLLQIHFIVAFGLTVALVVIIAIALPGTFITS